LEKTVNKNGTVYPTPISLANLKKKKNIRKSR